MGKKLLKLGGESVQFLGIGRFPHRNFQLTLGFPGVIQTEPDQAGHRFSLKMMVLDMFRFLRLERSGIFPKQLEMFPNGSILLGHEVHQIAIRVIKPEIVQRFENCPVQRMAEIVNIQGVNVPFRQFFIKPGQNRFVMEQDQAEKMFFCADNGRI